MSFLMVMFVQYNRHPPRYGFNSKLKALITHFQDFFIRKLLFNSNRTSNEFIR